MTPNKDRTPADIVTQATRCFEQGRLDMLKGASVHHNPYLLVSNETAREWFNGYMLEHTDFCQLKRKGYAIHS